METLEIDEDKLEEAYWNFDNKYKQKNFSQRICFKETVRKIIIEERNKLLLKFIASLCLSDHMGDVTSNIDYALKMTNIKIEWNDLEDLIRKLHKMNITTLCNTSLED